MTSSQQLAASLRSAAVRATLATSYLATEPWHLVLRDDALEIHADRDRQLTALDPRGRQLALSCGAALLNARVTLAALGCGALVERLPEPVEPDLLARLTLDADLDPDVALAQLDGAVEPTPASYAATGADGPAPGVTDALVVALRDAGVGVSVLGTPEEATEIRRLSRTSSMEQGSDPLREVELRAWRPLGPESASVVDEQTWLVLATPGDDVADWLAAGEAVQRVILRTRFTQGVRPHGQVIETPHAREQLRGILGLDLIPQAVLQIGLPVAAAPSRRRRLGSVLAVAR